MKLLIATDAWRPQVNGVVRTLDTTTRTLREMGHVVEVVEPSAFRQVGVPFYPEIRLALPPPGCVYDRVRRFGPDHVHVSTEGGIGLHACRTLPHVSVVGEDRQAGTNVRLSDRLKDALLVGCHLAFLPDLAKRAMALGRRIAHQFVSEGIDALAADV